MAYDSNNIRSFILLIFEIAERHKVDIIDFFCVERDLEDVADMLEGYIYTVYKWGYMWRVSLRPNSKKINLEEILK